MAQKIIKIGSSVGVTIPKVVLERLGLKEGSRVEVAIDEQNGGLHILPAENQGADSRRERIANLTVDFVDRYRADLEALADK